MQKNGAGLHTASTCFWDTKTDGKTTTYNNQLSMRTHNEQPAHYTLQALFKLKNSTS